MSGPSPRLLVAGIGCTSAVTCDEIVALVEMSLASAGHAPADLACLATIDSRAEIAALQAAAHHFDRPLRCFTPAELSTESPRLATPSARIAALAGLPGIAEAAALRAGSLLSAKRKSPHATCAIGRASMRFDVAEFGRAAGG